MPLQTAVVFVFITAIACEQAHLFRLSGKNGMSKSENFPGFTKQVSLLAGYNTHGYLDI